MEEIKTSSKKKKKDYSDFQFIIFLILLGLIVSSFTISLLNYSLLNSDTIDLGDRNIFTRGKIHSTTNFKCGTKSVDVLPNRVTVGGNEDSITLKDNEITVTSGASGSSAALKLPETVEIIGDLRFKEGNDGHYVGFDAPTGLSATQIYKLPLADGTSGQVINTDGNGSLSFTTVVTPSDPQTLSNKILDNAVLDIGVSGTAVLNDNTFGTASSTKIATSSSIKSYVDSVAAGLDLKASCIAATTGPGVSGTSFKAGETIDGVTLATNDRILIKDQTHAVENGIYTVTSGAPTRASDLAPGEDASGAFTFVQQGLTNADIGFVCTNDEGSAQVGSDSLSFTQFSAGGGSGDVSAASNFGATNRLIRSANASKGISGSVVTVTDTGLCVPPEFRFNFDNAGDYSIFYRVPNIVSEKRQGLRIISGNNVHVDVGDSLHLHGGPLRFGGTASDKYIDGTVAGGVTEFRSGRLDMLSNTGMIVKHPDRSTGTIYIGNVGRLGQKNVGSGNVSYETYLARGDPDVVSHLRFTKNSSNTVAPEVILKLLETVRPQEQRLLIENTNGTSDKAIEITTPVGGMSLSAAKNIRLSAADGVIIPTNIGLKFGDDQEMIKSNGTSLLLKSGGTQYSIPTIDGNPNDVLQTDGSGGLFFGSGTSGGGGTGDVIATSTLAPINTLIRGGNGTKGVSNSPVTVSDTGMSFPTDYKLFLNDSGNNMIYSDGTDIRIDSGGGNIRMELGTDGGDIILPQDTGIQFGKDTRIIETENNEINTLRIESPGDIHIGEGATNGVVIKSDLKIGSGAPAPVIYQSSGNVMDLCAGSKDKTRLSLGSKKVLLRLEDDNAANFDEQSVIIECVNGTSTAAVQIGASAGGVLISSATGPGGIIKMKPGEGGLITNRGVSVITDSATDPTPAQYVAGFIKCTGGGPDTWTLPSGPSLADAMPNSTVTVGDSFICHVVNESTGDITYEANATGSTLSTSGAGTSVQKNNSLAKLEFIFTDETDSNEKYYCLLIADNA